MPVTFNLVAVALGKKRAVLEIDRDTDNSVIEAAALALDPVRQATNGKAIKKIIIVPMRIVNVVI